MHWYGGSIAEAVTLSKQKNAIFVVFVEGDNDLSSEMAATIDDADVVSRLSNQTNFLAVKLKSGTTNYTHFAQIYQFVPVPSLFFIGRNGTPLEVVCAGVQPSNLATRIDRIIAEHHCEKLPQAQPSTSLSSQSIQDATVGLLQSEANASAPVNIPEPTKAPEAKTAVQEAPSPPKFPKPSESTPEMSKASADVASTDNASANNASADPASTGKASADKASDDKAGFDVVCDGDVCVRRPKTADQPSTSQATVVAPVTVGSPVTLPVTNVIKPVGLSSSETSVDDRFERAKELIEATRRQKADKEKELERQKELERRNTGQGVAELKKWQADQEMKQIQDERKREKLENNMARQRILEQIAQDRMERKARDAPAPPPLPTPSPAPPTTSHPATSGDAAESARVQFKLPDGTSHTAHFDAAGTLALVQRYVVDNLQLSTSSFALWTAFPRRELTDATATLRELGLAPSAALLVLPRRASTPTSGPTQYFSVYAFITQLLTTFIYQPSLVLFTWIRTRLFPPPAVGPRPPSTPAPPPGGSHPTGSSTTPRTGLQPRRRTNIHRLPGDSANDDDNNTWNGNSTQQM